MCPVCRAVVWRDVLSRTFGHAPGCPNSKYMVTTPTAPDNTKLETDMSQRGVFAKRPGKNVQTPYSLDCRGDCRPTYERGTGNFTISQASRFPPDKKPLGADGDYNPGYATSVESRTVPTRKPISPAFKDKSTKLDADYKSKYHVPDNVGPASYLRHNSWLEGVEMEKNYTIGGSALRSKAGRDVYGPGGIAPIGMVASPKRINCYVAHDHDQEWTTKTPTSKQKWVKKGKTIGRASRFAGGCADDRRGVPGPGEYHGSLSRPYSSFNTKIVYRDPDAIIGHRTNGDRPYTGAV